MLVLSQRKQQGVKMKKRLVWVLFSILFVSRLGIACPEILASEMLFPYATDRMRQDRKEQQRIEEEKNRSGVQSSGSSDYYVGNGNASDDLDLRQGRNPENGL